MSARQHVVEMLQEVFAPLGPVGIRRMFGGAGISCGGVMFGLIEGDVVYLKADHATKSAFESEGCGPFVYEDKTRPVAMPYWQAPERLYDDPDEFVEWGRRALAVATKTKQARRAKTAPRAKRATAPSAKIKTKPP